MLSLKENSKENWKEGSDLYYSKILGYQQWTFSPLYRCSWHFQSLTNKLKQCRFSREHFTAEMKLIHYNKIPQSDPETDASFA